MSIFLSCGPECDSHKILGKGKMFLGMVHSENLECWIRDSGAWSSAAPSPRVRRLYSPRTSCGCCRVKQCSCAWGRRLLSWPSDSGEPYQTEALHTRACAHSVTPTLSLPSNSLSAQDRELEEEKGTVSESDCICKYHRDGRYQVKKFRVQEKAVRDC